jgi:nitroimidazol reductase NimA-like FMN-containing flavoprotein (pyridoxamine 5'-phosphate oxidase superfamily)
MSDSAYRRDSAAFFEPTDRTRLQRYPGRARYERDAIYDVLDEALVCHMGFSVRSQPYVIPTLCARVDDQLYLHGSAASRALTAMTSLPRVCVTATILDGLVLSRSAFNHSVNYRSVVVIGSATLIADIGEKRRALEQFTNAIVVGRWDDVRPPTRQELKGTTILRIPLVEASLKSRSGGPTDPDEERELDAWAGVIPLSVRASEPIPDPTLREGIAVPRYVAAYVRNRS